jgi:DNA-binding transcriptional LysR family regulator
MIPTSTTAGIHLGDLRLLFLAADLGGLTAAARKLALPKASASRNLQRLEQAVGHSLAHRNGRRFVLTEEGRSLIVETRHAVQSIDGAVHALRATGEALEGLLRIAAPYNFGRTVVAPLLPSFLKAHLGLRVSLQLSSRPVDLFADEADVAIRVGPSGSDRLIARALAREALVLCAAPNYLRANPVAQPRDLPRHAILDFRSGGASRELELFAGRRSERVRITPALASNEPDVLYQAARQGAGIAILPQSFVGRDLDTGDLVRIISTWSLASVDINAVYRADRGKSRNVRAFLDHLTRRR